MLQELSLRLQLQCPVDCVCCIAFSFFYLPCTSALVYVGILAGPSFIHTLHLSWTYPASLTQGEHGAMGETRLESGRSNFSRNTTDVFEVVGSAIGTLKEATVRLVSAGADVVTGLIIGERQ